MSCRVDITEFIQDASIGRREDAETRGYRGAFSISHLTFFIRHLCLLFRVRPCHFVDRSHLSAKQAIHETT